MKIQFEAKMKCPVCKNSIVEKMPTDRYVWFYECAHCCELISPKAGDCCVFCSHGSVPCPTVQETGGRCG